MDKTEQPKMKMNIQLFGPDFPPLYGIKDILQEIDAITNIDEKINTLAIERELHVKALKEKVKNFNNTKDKD